jgi:hypothetical protein
MRDKKEIENKQITKEACGFFGGPAPVKDEPKEEPKKEEEVDDDVQR